MRNSRRFGRWALKQHTLCLYSWARARVRRLWETNATADWPQIPQDVPTDPKMSDQPVGIYKKIIPLAIVFFLSTFNLTILQALKDAIVVTNSGAEALPFLASFVVLPASIAYFAFYSKLVSSVGASWPFAFARSLHLRPCGELHSAAMPLGCCAYARMHARRSDRCSIDAVVAWPRVS